jgi:hypothetical protein
MYADSPFTNTLMSRKAISDNAAARPFDKSSIRSTIPAADLDDEENPKGDGIAFVSNEVATRFEAKEMGVPPKNESTPRSEASDVAECGGCNAVRRGCKFDDDDKNIDDDAEP